MFGGNLIQAPNPIDFDKVFVEFTRLSETGNVAILATIVFVFILYFVTIIFARRADNRDQNRVSTLGQTLVQGSTGGTACVASRIPRARGLFSAAKPLSKGGEAVRRLVSHELPICRDWLSVTVLFVVTHGATSCQRHYFSFTP